MDVRIQVTSFTGTYTRLVRLEQAMATHTHAILKARADEVTNTFARHTPVDTGTAAAGWHQEPHGNDEIDVVNEVTSPEGFNYPSALVTGTGQRGVPTSGFTGAFASRAGMAPGAALHADWEFYTHEPFVYGSFLPSAWP